VPIKIVHADYGPYRWQIREADELTELGQLVRHGQMIWRAGTKQAAVAHVAIEAGFLAVPEVREWARTKFRCAPTSGQFPLDKAEALVEKIVADYHWKRVLERVDWRIVTPSGAYSQACDSFAVVTGRIAPDAPELQRERWKASVSRVLGLFRAGARTYAEQRLARFHPGEPAIDVLAAWLREHPTNEMRWVGQPAEVLAKIMVDTLAPSPFDWSPAELAADPEHAMRTYARAIQERGES